MKRETVFSNKVYNSGNFLHYPIPESDLYFEPQRNRFYGCFVFHFIYYLYKLFIYR